MATFEERLAQFKEHQQYCAERTAFYLKLLRYTDSSMRQRAIEELVKLDYHAVGALIQELNSDNPSVVFYAKHILTRIGRNALDALIRVLQNESSKARSHVASVLGSIRSSDAIELLIGALTDKDSNVRQSAAYALMVIGDVRSVEALCQALTDTCVLVRRCAAAALNSLADVRATEPLYRSLKDDDAEVREYASEALAEINKARISEHLRKELVERDQSTLQSVSTAPTSLSPPQRIEQPHPPVKNRCAVSLPPVVSAEEQQKIARFVASICPKNFTEYTDWSKDVKNENEDEDSRAGIEDSSWDEVWDTYTVETIIQQLTDKDWHSRLIAIETLGEIGDTRAVEPLFRVLKDTDEEIRTAAVEALEKLELSSAQRRKFDAILARIQEATEWPDKAQEPKKRGRPPGKGTSKPAPVQSVAQGSNGYAIPKPSEPKKPFALDMESVQQKIAETAEVSSLLGTIFQEETPPVAVVAVSKAAPAFKDLDNAHYVFVKWLARRRSWTRAEVEQVALPLGLMVSGALEHLNEIAWEAKDEPAFEGDDPIEVNIELLEELLA